MKFPHIRIFGRLADRRFSDMRAERPKITAQPDLIFKADLLFAEEYDLVLDKRAVQLLDLFVRQRLRQIDIADLRADMRRDGLNRNGFIAHEILHWVLLCTMRRSFDSRDAGMADDRGPPADIVADELTECFRARARDVRTHRPDTGDVILFARNSQGFGIQ